EHWFDPKSYVPQRLAEGQTVRNKTLVKEWHQWRAYFSGRGDEERQKASSSASITIPAVQSWRVEAESQAATATSSQDAIPPSAIEDNVWQLNPTSAALTSPSISPLSSNKLGPGPLFELRTAFAAAFQSFIGHPWRLPSGTVVDDVQDQAENRYELPAFMIHEMRKFRKGPEQLQEMLSSGWRGLELGDKNDGISVSALEAFRACMYHSMLNMYMAYSSQNFELPKSQSESWYRTFIWGFLPQLFSSGRALIYEPGEKGVSASAARKNTHRDLSVPFKRGHMADGIISCRSSNCELCAIEFSKFEDGPTATKVLEDSRKLGKMLKDMFDAIMSKCQKPSIVQKSLRAYGLVISGRIIYFISVRYLDGRYFRLQTEQVMALPSVWDRESITCTIVALLSKLLIFKQRMLEMSEKVIEWTQVVDLEDIKQMAHSSSLDDEGAFSELMTCSSP
ncbi:hypothetical protein BX616_004872, partial [Lobosporangium transversale]